MFYQYKKGLIIGSVCIWSVVIFFIGMTFAPKEAPIMSVKKEPELKSKKINETMKIQSKSEGMIDYVIGDLTYTAKKQIIFNIQIKKMTSFNYIVSIQDAQNREIPYEQLGYKQEENTISYQFDVASENQEGDVYILIYPVSEMTYNSKQISDKAYGKTQVNIPAIRKSTIDKLR